jgi:hypothetical protein
MSNKLVGHTYEEGTSLEVEGEKVLPRKQAEKLNIRIDCSEALTDLKALQHELKETIRLASELENVASFTKVGEVTRIEFKGATLDEKADVNKVVAKLQDLP